MAILDWEGFDRETTNKGGYAQFDFFSVSDDNSGCFGYGRYASSPYGVILATSRFSTITDGFFQCHFYSTNGTIGSQGYKFSAYLGSTEQLQVRFYSGEILVYRGLTLLATFYNAFPAEQWRFLQIRFNIATSGGYVEVRINGTSVGSYSGNTANAGSNGWNGWRIYSDSGSTTLRVDNIVVYSATGNPPNTWTPETRILETLPTGAGGETGWTPNGAASNYQCVDEQPSDDDTTYVSAASAGLRDAYSVPASAPAGSIIYAVGVHATAREADAGPSELDTFLRIADSNYDAGAPAALTASYTRYRHIWDLNPATAAAWLLADADAAQPGIRRTT